MDEKILPNGGSVNQAVELINKTAGKEFSIVRASELNHGSYEMPEAIIEKLMYPGLINFAAPGKTGKSFLCLQLACAIAKGVPFWGRAVNGGSVLYCDFEGVEWRTVQRAKQMGLFPLPDRLDHVYRDKSKIEDDIFEKMHNWIDKVENPRVIIIDTIQCILGSRKQSENEYEAAVRQFEELHNLAISKGISIVGVTHTKKRSGRDVIDDPFELSIGSVGRFGSADTGWMISGKRGEAEKKFLVTGREIEDSELDIIRTETGAWKYNGTVDEVLQAKRKQEYLNSDYRKTLFRLLTNSGGAWRGTMTQLYREIGGNSEETPFSDSKRLGRYVKEVHDLTKQDGIEVVEPKYGGKNGRIYEFRRDDDLTGKKH